MPIAERHEVAKLRAQTESGYAAARERTRVLVAELNGLVDRILAEVPTSLADLALMTEVFEVDGVDNGSDRPEAFVASLKAFAGRQG